MLGPSAKEAAGLQFAVGSWPLRARYAAAIAALLIGGALFLMSWLLTGIAVIGLGHLLLWVKSQRLAPGGATPAHEQVWAPAEESWLDQVESLERRGEAWDTTPWDISNQRGALTLAAGLGCLWLFVASSAGLFWSYSDILWLGVLLLAPVWFSGMRSVWNPSELRLKGEALRSAADVARQHGGDRFDVVPLLALREGARGKYPVDTRTMLRPKRDPDGPFIGIQLQVALNNVRGTMYPYLYAVILVKEGGRLPRASTTALHDLVYEEGAGEQVRFMVVRQHADNRGGWHTGPRVIADIVETALRMTEELR